MNEQIFHDKKQIQKKSNNDQIHTHSLKKTNGNKNSLQFSEDLSSFTKIPSHMLEDLEYLKENYPNLLESDSIIYFWRYEFLDINKNKENCFRFGKVIHFNFNSKSFLVELIPVKPYENDSEIVNIPLKDFIELYVKRQDESESDEKTETDSKFGCLRRQIEYYFSDENFYKDSFLLSNLNEEDCIDILKKMLI